LYFSNVITKRELLVFDEVHNIESEISDFKSFIINNDNITRLFPKLKLPTIKEEEIETWIDFCEEYRDTLLEFIDDIEFAIETNNLKEPYTEKNLIDCINREKNLHFVLNDMKSNKNNWLVTNIDRKTRDSIRKITLTPLDISNYFQEILDLSSYGLFMSASILNKEYLCKISGLSKDEIKFIRIKESDFPKENRPIHLMNIAWLNSKNIMDNLPTIAKTVNNIMSIHKNEKGIIHTTSYFQLEFIKNNLNKENLGRLIETSPNTDRTEILQRHSRNPKPTVLISPSFYQGLDLKDDLSRFQIIIKIPYPDLSDKKVAALRKKDINWYLWNTIVRLTQTYGRSIRSKDDHASTYILDSNINYLLRNANDMFPKWFTEAIIYNN
jgi:Rad3-related DNA helicase